MRRHLRNERNTLNMESRFTSRIPAPRAGRSRFSQGPQTPKSKSSGEADSSTRCSTWSESDETDSIQQVALHNLEQRIQLIMEGDDDSIFRSPSRRHAIDDDHSSFLGMDEGNLMAETTEYILPSPKRYNASFGESSNSADIRQQQYTTHHHGELGAKQECTSVHQRQFLFPSESYFISSIEEPRQRSHWKTNKEIHAEYLRDRPPRPHIPSSPFFGKNPNQADGCSENTEKYNQSTVTLSEKLETTSGDTSCMELFQNLPNRRIGTQSETSKKASNNDKLSLDIRNEHTGKSDVPPVNDISYDRPINRPIHMAVEGHNESSEPHSVKPNIPQTKIRDRESKSEQVERITNLEQQNIVSPDFHTRISRYQRAMKTRGKATANESSIPGNDNDENQAPGKQERILSFHVDATTRRYRLSKANRRVKIHEKESVIDRDTPQVKTSSALAEELWSIRSGKKSPRVSKLLKERKYGKTNESTVQRNPHQLVAAVTLFFLRLKAQLSAGQMLTYEYGPPVLYKTPAENFCSFLLHFLFLCRRNNTAKLGAGELKNQGSISTHPEPTLMAGRIDTSIEMRSSSARGKSPNRAKKPATTVAPTLNETSADLEKTASFDNELDLLSSEIGNLVHPLFKVFVVTSMIETDLSRDEFIYAHDRTQEIDVDDDDDLSLELRMLPTLQKYIQWEIEFANVLEELKLSAKFESIGTVPPLAPKALEVIVETSTIQSHPTQRTTTDECKEVEEEMTRSFGVTESSFDEEEAKRVLHAAVLGIESATPSAMPMQLPVVASILQTGKQDQEQYTDKCNVAEIMGSFIHLNLQASVSTLSDCTTSVAANGPTRIPSRATAKIGRAHYQNGPSLLCMDSTSEEESLRLQTSRNVQVAGVGTLIPKINKVDKIEESRQLFECLPKAACFAFQTQTNIIKGACGKSSAKKDTSGNAATGEEAKSVSRTPVVQAGVFKPFQAKDVGTNHSPRSASSSPSESGSVLAESVILDARPSPETCSKQLSTSLQRDEATQDDKQLLFRQKLEMEVLDHSLNHKVRTIQTPPSVLERVAMKLLHTVQEKLAIAEREAAAESSQIDSGDEQSFYVVRSMASFETNADQEQSYNLKSPTWSMAPVLRSFSDTMEDSSEEETDAWSTAPNLTPTAKDIISKPSSARSRKGSQTSSSTTTSTDSNPRALTPANLGKLLDSPLEVGTLMMMHHQAMANILQRPGGHTAGDISLKSRVSFIRETEATESQDSDSSSKTISKAGDCQSAPLEGESDHHRSTPMSGATSNDSNCTDINKITISMEENLIANHPSFEMSIKDGSKSHGSLSSESNGLHNISIDEGDNVEVEVNETVLPSGSSVSESALSLSRGQSPSDADKNNEKLQRDNEADKPFESSYHSFHHQTRNYGGTMSQHMNHNNKISNNHSNNNNNKYNVTSLQGIPISHFSSREEHDPPRSASPETSRVVKDFARELLMDTIAKNSIDHSRSALTKQPSNIVSKTKSGEITDVQVIAEAAREIEIVATFVYPDGGIDDGDDNVLPENEMLEGPNGLKFLSDLSDSTLATSETGGTWSSSVVSSVSDDDNNDDDDVDNNHNKREDQSGNDISKNSRPKIISTNGPINLDAANDWDMEVKISRQIRSGDDDMPKVGEGKAQQPSSLLYSGTKKEETFTTGFCQWKSMERILAPGILLPCHLRENYAVVPKETFTHHVKH